MSHVDDGKLNALLDGELEGTEAAEVQAHIAACPECGKRLEEAKRFLSQAADLLGALELPAAPARDARRVSRTAQEAAIEVDGATAQSPAIGAVPPERLFRRSTQARPERHAFDHTSLAWAATIILAVGVGFLADEVRHVREGAGPTETRLAAPPSGAITGVAGAAATPAAAKAAPAPPAGVAGRTEAAPTTATAKPSAGGRNGPPAAKAPPGEASVTAARSATGLGHKRLEPPTPARTLALAAARPQPVRPAGNVTNAPGAAMAASPASPRDAAAGAALQAPAVAPAAAARGAERAQVQSAAEDAVPAPSAAGFRRATMEEAVTRLGGTIRLIDGMQSTRVEMGPGRLVPNADSAREVVRVVYGEPGGELILDQQRLRLGEGAAVAPAREAQAAPPLGPGDIVVTSSPDGLNGLRWMDRGVWMSLSGHVPADSLRRLADRVR